MTTLRDRKRNYWRSILSGLFLLAFIPTFTLAQSTSDIEGANSEELNSRESINLEDILYLALERNLNLKQSANDVTVNEANLAQLRANLLPNLNLSAGPSIRFGRSFDQTTAALSDQQSRALNLNASSSVNLFSGFADLASVKEGNLNVGASEQTFQRERQRILYEVASQYFQIALNEELIDVEVENLNAQMQQLESIQAGYDAGNRPIADVLQQQASIAQTEQRLIAARRDYALSALQLKQLLDLDPQAEVQFVSPDTTLFNLDTALSATDALVQDAVASRSDIIAQRLRIQAADAAIRVAKAGYYPSVSLTASTGTNYSSLNNQFGFSDQLTDLNPNGSVGLSVSIPVFNRLQTKAGVERARVSYSNEQLALEALEQEIAFDVQQALLDQESAQAQFHAAERQFDSARESLRAAEARYDVGASTLLEVTQARSVYVEASVNRLVAQYTILLNELGIGFSIGQIEEVLSLFL